MILSIIQQKDLDQLFQSFTESLSSLKGPLVKMMLSTIFLGYLKSLHNLPQMDVRVKRRKSSITRSSRKKGDNYEDGKTLLFLKSEERSSLRFILLLWSWWKCLWLSWRLFVNLGLLVDGVHPKVHLIIILCLEQVVTSICKSANTMVTN